MNDKLHIPLCYHRSHTLHYGNKRREGEDSEEGEWEDGGREEMVEAERAVTRWGEREREGISEAKKSESGGGVVREEVDVVTQRIG